MKLVINLPDHFIYSTKLSVRISDINYGNHLGHDAFVSLLHEARVAFLHAYQLSEINIFGSSLILSALSVLYKNQAFYGDEIEFFIGIGEVSKSSVEFIYQAINVANKKEIGRAMTRLVFFDYPKQEIREVPIEFLALIKSLS